MTLKAILQLYRANKILHLDYKQLVISYMYSTFNRYLIYVAVREHRSKQWIHVRTLADKYLLIHEE